MFCLPCIKKATRSRPMPVSMLLLRQRAGDVEVLLRSHGTELVLHEDEVPELQVAVLGAEVAVSAVLGTTVVEDLRARAAGAGDAHRPVVLGLAQTHDPVVGQAGDPLPELHRLRVVLVDARVEAALLEAPAAVGDRLGDQVPGQLDRAFLEVVAEREVAAHLEERAVPGGLADVLDVGGPHALLHTHRPVVRRCLLAEEVRLERHHARVDEQQVGVLRQQRARRHSRVTSRLEVLDEATADLSGVHG